MTDHAPPRVYFDTNVFITAFETVGARSDHAWWLLEAIEASDLSGTTSELTLAELLVKPIESGADDLVDAYDAIIRPNTGFDVVPMARDVLVEAARLRARRRAIRLPDAIHVASAQQQHCTHFVSADRAIDLPEPMRLVPLGPHALSDILGDARS